MLSQPVKKSEKNPGIASRPLPESEPTEVEVAVGCEGGLKGHSKKWARIVSNYITLSPTSICAFCLKSHWSFVSVVWS